MNVAIGSAIAAFIVGSGCAVGGVYVLSGLGWALIAGSAACFLICAVLFRGVRSGGA